jgi:DNA-binding protein HU-beta
MNHSDLVAKIVEIAKVSKTETTKVLDTAAQIIIEAARAGEEVRLNGLGFFDGLKREARSGRNPNTGEPIKIAASTTLRFRVGKAAKEQLNLPTPKRAGTKRSATHAQPARQNIQFFSAYDSDQRMTINGLSINFLSDQNGY